MLITTDNIIYDVYDDSENQINIEIIIGYEQPANTFLQLDQTPIGNDNGSFNKDIGRSKDLKGHKLIVITTIHDMNPNTDKVSLEIILSGGKNPLSKKIFDIQLNQSGDAISSIVNIYFI